MADEFHVIIRRMRAEDAAYVAEIERKSFSEPWPEKEFTKASAADNYIYLVAEHNNKIIGYAGCVFAADEADITNIAVDSEVRRMGIGRRLLLCLVEQAQKAGLANIFLEVRESNINAINLYIKSGFEKISVRKRFYSNPQENAIIMKKKAGIRK